MKILVINAGSSSLKYQLIDMANEQVMAKGLCERIGIDGHLKHSPLVGAKLHSFNSLIALVEHYLLLRLCVARERGGSEYDS